MSLAQVDLSSRPAPKDLRSEPRKALGVPAAVVPVNASMVRAHTANVSAHGVDLTSDIDLRPATRCEVAFSLPINGNLRPIRVQACVVRSEVRDEGFSLGLVFFGMPQSTQELLELFIWS